MKKLHTLRLAVASVLALGVANVHAVQKTDQLDVTATVIANCFISASNLEFGNYDPIDVNALGGADVDNQFAITTTCTKDAAVTTTIGNGMFVAGTRHMDNAGARLAYQLYSNAARNAVWDNTELVGVSGTGAAVVTDVYGRVPAGQDATTLKVGTYTDTLTVTVDF